MKIVAIIQARMSSSRLPKKVMANIYKDLNTIEIIVRRVKKSKLIDNIIVATTSLQSDDRLVDFLKKKISTTKLSNKELIKKNILSHLSSKKKIALNLSGGIDSNLILSEITKSGRKIDIFSTYCECKDNNYNNDFFIARSVAKKLNLKFIETYVTKKEFS